MPVLPDLFQSQPLLAAAYARVSASIDSNKALDPPTDGINAAKYSIPLPSSSSTSPEDWQTALETAYSTLEHQQARLSNVELLTKFGPNAWRISNFLLEKQIERVQREIEGTIAATEDLNRQRKSTQVRFPLYCLAVMNVSS